MEEADEMVNGFQSFFSLSNITAARLYLMNTPHASELQMKEKMSYAA